jgi:periplasmic copper chaperone A
LGYHRIRSKSLSSFAALWVSALGLVAALVGCGGENVQTTATLGVGGRVGDIVVRDAALRFDRPVAGGTVYQPGDDAALQLTIVNEGDRPDRLVRVTSPIARLGVIIGDARMAGHQALTAGYQAPLASATLPGTNAVRIVLVGLRSPVSAGLRYPVVFDFERAGELRLDLPVENPRTLPSLPDQPPP